MKSRYHRMTSSDPKDDWVDGSWTVDCVCGVNYDDGEEMVDCDECGVWVHTRCSRYVKSEKSFACDKCKIRNSRNDSEETEVAQLLIELPTKTMRMESSYNQSLSSDQPPPRRPVKLWTEKPMEDRVHIQGIPGGDPALFAGKSSVFSPALWKAAGYVPKKFNFQYREFPCWDRNEDASPNVEQEIENPIDKGANVLFSFSKENASNTYVGMKERGEQENDERELGSKEGKKYKGENLDNRHSPKATTKSRRPFAIHSCKKKEVFITSKERNGKKRARDHEESANIKNKVPVKPTSDAKEFEFHEDKVAKFNKSDSQSILPSNSGHTVFHQTLPIENGLAETNLENRKNNIVDHSSQAFNCDISRDDCTKGAVQKEQQDGYQIFGSAETSSKVNCVAPRVGSDYAGSVLLRGDRMGADTLDSNGEHLSTNAVLESRKQDSAVALPKLESSRIVENSNGSILHRPEQAKVKVETEGGHSDSIADMKQSSPLSNKKSACFNYSVQYTRISSNHMEESFKVDDSTVKILKSSDDKAQDVEGSSEAVGGGYTDKMKELSDDHYQPNQDVKVIDACNALSKSSSNLKDDSIEAEGQLKSGEIVPGAHPPVSSQRKMVVCVGKSSSMPPTNLVSKSSICEDAIKVNSRTSDPITKQRISSGGIIKKDDAASNAVNEENEMPRKYPKDLSRSSVGSTVKTLHSSKSLQSSVSKHMAESKEPVVYTSSRASSRQNAAVTISSGEAVEPSQTQNASFGQNKITSSGSLQKGDKLIQSSGQSSSKVTLTRAANPPAPSSSPATLSDEELALLLHQELNSSPRVPRVPRVRQVGCLPQLGSPTATSMLKPTSSFGGNDHKDHSSMSRKKVKDVKNGSRGVHERLPSSPSRRRQTSGDVADASTRKKLVNGSPETINLVKKNMRSTSSETTNSVPSSSEATGQNSSSIRNSPSNISDDVTSVGRSSVHRTLPGLINEIMSKGKRMTYEELCNAVLPHWNNLRKHNGERYAYASHFQAVLDCLRNRTEWAQLVDRGPKTNAGRKKRKVDPEQQLSFESEDKHRTGRTEEVESKNLELHREEVPKGKRKARKRRLALQGRGVKDVRKKRKADVISDDDNETSQSSKSSDQCLFSDDEFQGGETCRAETEDLGSSDET